MKTMKEIVLNEREWAENAIHNLDIGSEPLVTLRRVARLYYDEGHKKSEISRLLELFMVRCDPTINIVPWQSNIDYAVKHCDKYPLLVIDSISITQNEMEAIKALGDSSHRRLFFTILCLAKFGNARNAKNNYWCNQEMSDIFRMADIKITKKRQCLMLNDLWAKGYIGYSKIIDNLNLQVLVHDDDSDVVAKITDFRHLGNQYLMLTGGNFFACEDCGCVVKKTGHIQKYCSACAPIINIKKTSRRRAEKSEG